MVELAVRLATNMAETKILVARGGALGDFILTLPVLAALRRAQPGGRVALLAHPAPASLAVAAGLADEVASLESARFAGLFAPGGGCPAETAAWLGSFDSVVSFLHDPGGVFQASVARCSAARFVAGPHRPDETSGETASWQLLRTLRQIGIEVTREQARPDLAGIFGPAPIKPNPKRLAAHPGSGSARKNWPEASWRELLRRMVDNSSLELLLIGGEVEAGRCERLAAAWPASRVRLAVNLPLPELARQMAGCSGYLGHDSGVTHLAAALGLPGVVIWGATVQAVWAPQSSRVKILAAGPSLGDLPVDDVMAALEPWH